VDIKKVWSDIISLVIKTVIALTPELKVFYQSDIPTGRPGPTCFQVITSRSHLESPALTRLRGGSLVYGITGRVGWPEEGTGMVTGVGFGVKPWPYQLSISYM
jgi:hypothetical protein